jgi:hypothetical protein
MRTSFVAPRLALLAVGAVAVAGVGIGVVQWRMSKRASQTERMLQYQIALTEELSTRVREMEQQRDLELLNNRWHRDAELKKSGLSTPDGSKPKVRYSLLGGDVEIVGRLGYPLGTMLTVEGTRVEGDSKYHLRVLGVDRVNGEELPTPVDIDVVFFSDSMRNLTPTGTPIKPSVPIFDISEPRVGDRVVYKGYEDGGMVGFPEEVFKYLPAIASDSRHFKVSFIALEVQPAHDRNRSRNP